MRIDLWSIRVHWHHFVERAKWWPYRRKHSAGQALTLREHQLLCDILSHAFIEVRALGQTNKAEQVARLGHAMHNVPNMLASPGGGWAEMRERLERYQQAYPREAGSYWDYLGMLNLIDKPCEERSRD